VKSHENNVWNVHFEPSKAAGAAAKTQVFAPHTS
jgi:hypothetical protein